MNVFSLLLLCMQTLESLTEQLTMLSSGHCAKDRAHQ